jgi:hypothetical protein
MTDVDEWLRTARDAVAAEAGVDGDRLELSTQEEAQLLELARIAAHESGERTNAPLLCYLVGLAAARSGVSVERLAAAVSRSSS